MVRTSVLVCGDGRRIAERALDLLVDGLRGGAHLHGEAHLALTGGSSAAALFERLATDPRARRVDWARVHVWQGDERFVPHDHPDSNWAGARRLWLDRPDGPGIPEDHRHPIPVGEAIASGQGPDWAAQRYAAELERVLPRRAGLPSFDVMLLGVGTDGHILSAFPESRALAPDAPLVTAVPAPRHVDPKVARVSLAARLVMAAALVVVMVPGDGKGSVVRQCFDTNVDVSRLPAQWAVRPNAVWLLDRGSASAL